MKIMRFSKIISAACVAASFSMTAHAAPIRIGFGSDISASGIFNLDWQYDLTLADGSIKRLQYAFPIGFSMRFWIDDQDISNPVGDCPIVTIGGDICGIVTSFGSPSSYLSGGISIDRATRQASGTVRLIDWGRDGDGFTYSGNLL